MKNSIKAYSIRAKIDGQSWSTKSTTLTAGNKDSALLKFKTIFKTEENHIFEIKEVEVFSNDSILEINNYPYGYLKTTAFFSVEYKKNKGFRTVFQTINPKNNRTNNAKKGTYSEIILPCINTSNNMVGWCGYLSFNGTEEINRGLHFMNDFFELLTPEQIKETTLTVIGMTKVDIKASVIYAGSNFEELKPLYDKQIKTLVKIANSGENLFLSCLLDIDKIEQCKKPDFNPFKVTSYGI